MIVTRSRRCCLCLCLCHCWCCCVQWISYHSIDIPSIIFDGKKALIAAMTCQLPCVSGWVWCIVSANQQVETIGDFGGGRRRQRAHRSLSLLTNESEIESGRTWPVRFLAESESTNESAYISTCLGQDDTLIRIVIIIDQLHESIRNQPELDPQKASTYYRHNRIRYRLNG